ncbi:MAG: DUF4827 domain-containing protein [Bacteroides sp.]|nr:DUF4827 domain-containing protein [Bacteroides sp.]MCM1414237.1 DUF4827 domain-containing protein [Bacteroides sp.]MCM1471264.1 DUF4827 domain-containing protein [Bacteroides sp.]
MKFRSLIIIMMAFAAILPFTACESGRSYSELLNDENIAVNRFLADQCVFRDIPADTVFETGVDAPYYRLDGDNNIYMQVVSLGDGDMAQDDQVICFRFMRYNLAYYDGDLANCPSEGNQDNMANASTSFRFNNYTLQSSSQWGSGLQLPLEFIPLNSEINLIVKSQYGWTSEVSNVIPFLYHVRYFKSEL